MSEETITTPSRAENSFNPEIIYNYGRGRIKFKGICLKQDSVFYWQKCSKFIYLVQSRYMVKRFKHRFYIRQLLIWCYEVN